MNIIDDMLSDDEEVINIIERPHDVKRSLEKEFTTLKYGIKVNF